MKKEFKKILDATKRFVEVSNKYGEDIVISSVDEYYDEKPKLRVSLTGRLGETYIVDCLFTRDMFYVIDINSKVDYLENWEDAGWNYIDYRYVRFGIEFKPI